MSKHVGKLISPIKTAYKYLLDIFQLSRLQVFKKFQYYFIFIGLKQDHE
jgi:hypothetical protein